MAKARKRSKPAKSKKRSKKKIRKSKQIPLRILEKRLVRLANIVSLRKGRAR